MVRSLISPQGPLPHDETCYFIYPISGTEIEAWVVTNTDKRTDSSIKEAFILMALEALLFVLLAHYHKATVWVH